MGDAAGGLFVAVVGPSGAGKDTMLDFARAAFAEDPNVIFAQRFITRPADAGGEHHTAVTGEEFDGAVSAGKIALWWEAHGLKYGIPAEMKQAVAEGKCVVANLSRAALDDAAEVFGQLHVLHVTAPADVIAARLAGRGRESASDIVARRKRADLDIVTNSPVTTINTDRPTEVSGALFVDGLRAALQKRSRSI